MDTDTPSLEPDIKVKRSPAGQILITLLFVAGGATYGPKAAEILMQGGQLAISVTKECATNPACISQVTDPTQLGEMMRLGVSFLGGTVGAIIPNIVRLGRFITGTYTQED